MLEMMQLPEMAEIARHRAAGLAGQLTSSASETRLLGLEQFEAKAPGLGRSVGLWQGADPLHARYGAVRVLPDEASPPGSVGPPGAPSQRHGSLESPRPKSWWRRCVRELSRSQGEEDTALRIVGAFPRSRIRPPIVNEPRGGDHHPTAALLDTLHVPKLSADRLPQAAQIGGVRAKGFVARFQNGKGGSGRRRSLAYFPWGYPGLTGLAHRAREARNSSMPRHPHKGFGIDGQGGRGDRTRRKRLGASNREASQETFD